MKRTSSQPSCLKKTDRFSSFDHSRMVGDSNERINLVNGQPLIESTFSPDLGNRNKNNTHKNQNSENNQSNRITREQ